MDLRDLLDRDSVVVRGAGSKRQALQGVADLAARRFGADPEAVLEALVERERSGSTGIGEGVAVPHARLPALGRMRGVFLRLEHPVAFEAVDDKPVDLLFGLFAPRHADTEHLRALARVSRTLRRPELREALRQARSPDALYALLAQEPQSTAA